ncbi:MAG TPA: heme exporter protein CcmD [Pyrinomonadaceae bacterium]
MNWVEFFNMGGYAFYVWGSFGVALFLMGAEILLLRRRRKRALLRQARQAPKMNVLKENETTT